MKLCVFALILAAITLAVGTAADLAGTASSVPAYITAAVGDPSRTAPDVARDSDRRPAEVVNFAMVKPGDKVVDLVPGDGYYTRILAKIAGPRGHVYAFVPYVGNPTQQNQASNAGPRPVDAVLALQNMADFSNVTVLWEQLTSWGGQFAVPEQVDVVFSADNYHDLHSKRAGAPNMAGVTKEIFRSLKPGGIYYVLDHAATKEAGFTQAETLHRSDADAVKAEVLGAGFTLDGESKLLASTADDHTGAVMDAAAADKSDQFILKFRKPLTATAGDNRPPADFLAGWDGNTAMYSPGTDRARAHIYHLNGTYEEFGKKDMQAGAWFWAADGKACQVHQYPAAQRQFIVCHTLTAHKIGDSWVQQNENGPVPITMMKGYVRP